jgi:hypothetical protein
VKAGATAAAASRDAEKVDTLPAAASSRARLPPPSHARPWASA